MLSCELEQTQSDVYGCCDDQAWNYNLNTTIHADSLCIYNFSISTPSEGDLFNQGESVTITWAGGDSETNIFLSVVNAETDSIEFILSENMENTLFFDWNNIQTNNENFLPGDKKIYILQDLNRDDTQNVDSLLYNFSSIFTILE